MNTKNEISKKDFVLVQQDEKIHDLKFETKPTTYWKDAMRRFVKNKSSVGAGFIIGILILLAVFVPIFNTNDISTSQTTYKFLPPRWPGFENSSVLNGRREVKGIIVNNLDPDPANHYPLNYEKRAIYGEMETYESTTNIASIYAKGGKLNIVADSINNGTGIQTRKIEADFATDFALQIEIDDELNSNNKYEIYVMAFYNGQFADGKKITLKQPSYDYGISVFDDFSQTVLNNRPSGITGTSFYVQIGIYIPPLNTDFAKLYINNLVVTNIDSALEEDNPFAKHNFVEANELLLRKSTESANFAYRYQTVISGSQFLYNGIVTRANFVYDFYEEVYGEITYNKMGLSELQRFKARGLIDFDDDPDLLMETFVILDDSSPVREVLASYHRVVGKYDIYEFDVTVSMYRYNGFSQIPYYLFGTNERGHDFFKVVFNGLRTSLILGFSAAAINIIIGLIWGAISGYYGGNVDLAMERITDILGGVPWIIVMTLTILHLGNNFGVFLLALILTGWIGVSSTTRSQFYRYKRREYVLASRTLGAKDGRLIFKHILPNSIGPIVTGAVMMIPSIIFSEATISYLGLGLQGLTSFGVALSEVQNHIGSNPYLIVSGSIVIALLMISFNLFGNGLRDAFNPSLKGVE